jgi:hypothetical protein
MQTRPSVHDNHVYAYSVDCERRRLILHTAFRETKPHGFTDVVFNGMVAHQFDYVLSGNILFDVTEAGIGKFVMEFADLFADSWRYGWPPVEYRGDLDELIKALTAASVRAYEINSSYGMSGWVLAAGYDLVPRSEAATIA